MIRRYMINLTPERCVPLTDGKGTQVKEFWELLDA